VMLGPSGVGKTEFARSLSRYMFGSEDAMIRIDMTEYMNAMDTQKLIGPPPGYVGFEKGGQLTNHVQSRPYSIVLLDEIEKAHEDVFKLLLQVMQEGELRDGKGKVANFKNTIILMTSNLGFTERADVDRQESDDFEKVKELLNDALKHFDKVVEGVTDQEVIETLRALARTLTAFRDDLKVRGVEDGLLDQQILDLSWLADGTDFASTINETRLAKIKGFWTKVRDGLDKQIERDMTQVYKLIAGLKDYDCVEEEHRREEIVKFAKEMLMEEREFLLSKMLISSDPEDEKYGELAERFKLVSEMLNRDDAEIPAVLLKYLQKTVRDRLEKTIKAKFAAELIGRINLGNMISFNPLSMRDLDKILDIKLRQQAELLGLQGYGLLKLSRALRDEVLDKGYDVVYGARPLQRALRMIVLAPLAKLILANELEKGKEIHADYVEGEVVFEFVKPEDQEEMLDNGYAIKALRANRREELSDEDVVRMLRISWQRQCLGLKGMARGLCMRW